MVEHGGRKRKIQIFLSLLCVTVPDFLILKILKAMVFSPMIETVPDFLILKILKAMVFSPMIEWKQVNFINIYAYIFTLKNICLPWKMSQIRDIYTTFSDHLKRSSLSQNIIFCLISSLSPGYFVSC